MARTILVFVLGALFGATALYVHLLTGGRVAPAVANASGEAASAVAPAPSTPAAPKPPSVTIPSPTVVPPATLSSQLISLPIAGLTAADLYDSFGDKRTAGSHDAIDIMKPRGTPVVAVADGRIVKLFESKQGGNTIYQFDVPEIYCYYYAHLDRYAPGLIEGQSIKRGDLIGYVGSTGSASKEAPHLHFSIFQLGPEKQWWKGTAMNPYPVLKALVK